MLGGAATASAALPAWAQVDVGQSSRLRHLVPAEELEQAAEQEYAKLLQEARSQGKLVPAVEVMLLSPFVSDLILKGQTDELKDAMAKSNEIGMKTFDQSLYELYQAGDITAEQAVEYADSRTDVSLRIRLHTGQRPSTEGLGIQR